MHRFLILAVLLGGALPAAAQTSPPRPTAMGDSGAMAAPRGPAC